FRAQECPPTLDETGHSSCEPHSGKNALQGPRCHQDRQELAEHVAQPGVEEGHPDPIENAHDVLYSLKDAVQGSKREIQPIEKDSDRLQHPELLHLLGELLELGGDRSQQLRDCSFEEPEPLLGGACPLIDLLDSLLLKLTSAKEWRDEGRLPTLA